MSAFEKRNLAKSTPFAIALAVIAISLTTPAFAADSKSDPKTDSKTDSKSAPAPSGVASATVAPAPVPVPEVAPAPIVAAPQASTPLVARPTAPLALAPTAPASSGIGFKVCLVALAILAGGWWWKRKRPGTKTAAARPRLEVVARTSVGLRSEILIVEVDGQRILLGVTPHAVRHLVDLENTADSLSTSEESGPVVRRYLEDSPRDRADRADRDSAAPIDAEGRFSDLLRRARGDSRPSPRTSGTQLQLSVTAAERAAAERPSIEPSSVRTSDRATTTRRAASRTLASASETPVEEQAQGLARMIAAARQSESP